MRTLTRQSLLIVAFALTETPPAHSMTIREAIDLGLSNGISLQTAKEKSLEVASQTSFQARSLFPSLSAYGRGTTRKDALLGGAPTFGGEVYNVYESGLQANLTLFHGGALWEQIAKVRKDEQIAAIDENIAERDLRVNVLTKFYSILLAQKQIETYSRTEQLLRSLVSSANARVRMGTERRATVLQFQTQLALTTPKVQDAQNQLTIAATELADLLNIRDVSTLQVTGGLSEQALLAISDRFLKTPASGERPEILKSKLQLEQVENIAAVTLSDSWPALTATAQWGRAANQPSDLFDSNSTAWSMGLQLNIPLFSGFSSFSQRRVIAHQRAGQRLALASLSSSLTLERARNEKSLELLKSQVITTRTALELAQESLRQAQTDYNRGLGLYTQLFDAQQALVNAELSHDNTLYQFFTALVNFHVTSSLSLDPFIDALEQSQGVR